MAQWMNVPPFIDADSNRKCPHEQEGFSRSLSTSADEVPRCSSIFYAYPVMNLADHRGAPPDEHGTPVGKTGPHADRSFVEWETSPAETSETTVFTWIGGSQVRPALTPAYPYITATLYINGERRLVFPLGCSDLYIVRDGGYSLTFEPRRLQSLAEELDRYFSPHGVSGFYRLEVPGEQLVPGKPLTLRVELQPTDGSHETFFFLSPRADVLSMNLSILRDEVAQLQADMVQLKRSHEMLYAQVYPHLFPRRVQGKLVIAHQHETRHMHPANISAMSDGEVVIAFRDAQAHLDRHGRMMLVRSYDGGESWRTPEEMFALPNADHRSSAILELPNGDWVTYDYRAGSLYDDNGIFSLDEELVDLPSTWCAWSSDKGRHWNQVDDPLVSPHARNRFTEPERHPLLLPSGRILLAANTVPKQFDERYFCEIAIFASDDNGRHWHYLSQLPLYPFIDGEPSLILTDEGDIILTSRSRALEPGWSNTAWTQAGMVVQFRSEDKGVTWSQGEPTPMSSMSAPTHLLRLKDGRILCSHASRAYPGSIFVTVSADGGRSWPLENTRVVANDIIGYDSCYPTTCQLSDGALITAWYANLLGKFFLATLKYSPDELPG